MLPIQSILSFFQMFVLAEPELAQLFADITSGFQMLKAAGHPAPAAQSVLSAAIRQTAAAKPAAAATQ